MTTNDADHLETSAPDRGAAVPLFARSVPSRAWLRALETAARAIRELERIQTIGAPNRRSSRLLKNTIRPDFDFWTELVSNPVCPRIWRRNRTFLAICWPSERCSMARPDGGLLQMSEDHKIIPPMAAFDYEISQDLLSWMIVQFNQVGNCYQSRLYGVNAYFLNDIDNVQTIIRDRWWNYNKNTIAMKRIRILTGNGIITSEGALWKRQRRMMQPAFNHDAIRDMSDIIVDSNKSLLTKWEHAARDGRAVNVTRDINAMVLETVLVSIFAEDYPIVAAEFKILAEEPARNFEFAEAFRPLREVVTRVATRRRTESRAAKDVLWLLMEARDRDSREAMSLEELITEIMTLIVAGYETTSLTLAWTWYLLSRNVEVDAKLGAHLKNARVEELRANFMSPLFGYCRQVLDETLRLYPPIWVMVRKASKSDFLGDYLVPAGTEIYFSPYLIQRSPALWGAPDRFDPGRFDADRSKGRRALAMLPFGAGPRNCIGEGLARFEMLIHLIVVAQKLQLRYDDQTSPELETGVNLRPRCDFIMFPEYRPTSGG